MGESSSNHHTAPPPLPSSSRLGPTRTGEIVEVQGGHIVRSTGRKDRHSKVCTAKGPRDRRVRLAAHTAIQFYDVQDRLGYDRPSKAVDWLIKKAKTAIDELAQLPPWHPTAQNASFEQENAQKKAQEDEQLMAQHPGDLLISGQTSKRPMNMMLGGEEDEEERNTSFIPSSLDSDAIADTIKSFFPVGGGASTQVQSFPSSDLLPGNSSSNSQDLRLSLQSFQDPILQHHTEQAHHQQGQQGLLSFDGTPAWAWNSDSSGGNGGGGGAGFLFNSPPQPTLQQLLGHHTHFSSQRGPLQSSNTPSIRAWMDPSDPNHHHLLPTVVPIYPSTMPTIGYHPMMGGGFSGFPIPARIQGDVEEHDGYSDKPSSVSSDSRH